MRNGPVAVPSLPGSDFISIVNECANLFVPKLLPKGLDWEGQIGCSTLDPIQHDNHLQSIEVEGELFMSLGLIGVMIDPNRLGTDVFDLEETIQSGYACQVVDELFDSVPVLLVGSPIACLEPMIDVLNDETDGMVNEGSPTGCADLSLSNTRQAVIAGPRVEPDSVEHLPVPKLG